jgi:predicted anti-sigma-YlaC factor YlaD
MDCKAASDLIMKSLDNEITNEERAVLYGHLDKCRDCSLEYEALKETFSLLESVELEDPPDDLERVVISRIREEDKVKVLNRKWLTMIITILAIAVGWILLACLFLYTPAADIIKIIMSGLLLIAGNLFRIAGNIIRVVLSIATKIWIMGKVFVVVGNAFIEMYNTILITIILFILTMSSFYSYTLKSNRR